MIILSRLVLNVADGHVRRDLRDAQDLHRTIMSAFGAAPDPTRAREHFGVLHRLDTDRRGQVILLVQSAEVPMWSVLPETYLLDGAMVSGDLSPVLARLAPGQTLAFRLIANPIHSVVRRGDDGIKVRGRKVPVVDQDGRHAWLEARLNSIGARLLDEGQTPISSVVADHRASVPRTFSGVRFDGLLKVVDPQLFVEGVRLGIGSGKAFGFGLLSIARPGQVAGDG